MGEYVDRYNQKHYVQRNVRLPKEMVVDTHGLSFNSYVQSLLTRDGAASLPWIHERSGIRCPGCYRLWEYAMHSKPLTWKYCPACGYMVSCEGAKDK